MQEDRRATSHKLLILLLATIAVALYLVSLYLAYPVLQNTKLTDPLACIHSLFPLYYVAIAIIAITCFISFIYHVGNRGIHFLLLLLLAIMLWYTPYYLAGFIYQPDGPWHVGVAVHLEEVLSGEPILGSWYAKDFLSSFLFHYSFIGISGIDPLFYISKVFPLICILLFVSLFYAFISQLFNSRITFLSLLLAIPGLHYIQLHPSPRAIGVLLMLTVLVLVFKKGIASRALAFCLIIVVASAHTISPLLLLAFLGGALVTSFTMRISTTQAVLASMVVVCFVSWFFWPSIQAPLTEPMNAAVEVSGEQFDRVSVAMSRELDAIEKFILGSSFIYHNIYSLNKVIYILYMALAVVLLVRILVTTYLRQNTIKTWVLKLGGLGRNQISLAMSAFVLLILTLLLAGWQHDLAERSLTFVILILSCLIASAGVSLLRNKRMKFILLLFVMFLTLSYPVVAYSIDAYTGCPKSEESGLKFLANEVDTAYKKTVILEGTAHLALYSPYSLGEKYVNEDTITKVDFVAFRSTGYYYRAMRFDLSFDDNLYTEYQGLIKGDDTFNEIYLNPTTEIYGKNWISSGG